MVAGVMWALLPLIRSIISPLLPVVFLHFTRFQSENEMKALVRALPKSFALSAIRSDTSKVIDQALAEAQHHAYCETLRKILGNESVVEVPPRNEQPDSCFVEDTVVVLQKSRSAIGLIPGALSRREESKDVHNVLNERWKIPIHVARGADECLDGGDVLFTGQGYLVGLSKRTSPMGAKRFKQLVHDFEPASFVEFVKVPFGLHLKSLCTMAGTNSIVVSAACTNTFQDELRKKSKGAYLLQVPDPEAANVVFINDKGRESALIIREEFTSSSKLLRAHAKEQGIDQVYELRMGEIAKADGALTCCSVLVNLN